MQYAVVTSSVADVRNTPIKASGKKFKDPHQETQVLFGDLVLLDHTYHEWSRVFVLDQPYLTSNTQWTGYPGWIESSSIVPVGMLPDLPNCVVCAKIGIGHGEGYDQVSLLMGSKLFAQPDLDDFQSYFFKTCKNVRYKIDKSDIAIVRNCYDTIFEPMNCFLSYADRERIIHFAATHIGDPYHWGGYSSFSPHVEDQITGLDCSALVHLSYRLVGIVLPRNARHQHLMCSETLGSDLEMGDLIFLQKQSSSFIDHVMLYAGSNEIIEAKLDCNMVRRISVHERLGSDIAQLKNGDRFKDESMYFAKVSKSFCIPS
jgi:hypothetical protein